MKSPILALDRHVTAAVTGLACALLVTVCVLGLYQVVTRFVLAEPSAWTEEVTRRLLIWMVLLGCAAAFRHGALVTVDLLYNATRGPGRRALQRLITAASLAFLAVVLWFGVDITWRIRYQTFASIDVSIAWAYAALPVGALFSMLAVLANHFDPKRLELETAQ